MGGASGRKRKCWPVLAISTLAMEGSQYREPVLDAKSEVTGQVSGRPAWSAAACARSRPLLADPSPGCASVLHPKG
ncbi:similar to OTTHUMP00000018508 (predicted), isoform CRA_d [Rattus norvegicus]|uniref:Similar to OTTHUMP00000018508 (Predicted), isoform CRA_d n=1 Tax=Rattus norvegicus TaxID=10116 RepID=A6HU75_RAT|nr:similar to OTTHUMP00000018508 (predicted), isoform CRA_d [Rattus norvegicus]